MEIGFFMSEQNVRRLKSIVKGASNVYFLVTKDEAHFIVDSIDFFKSITLPVSGIDSDLFLSVNSDVFKSITEQCVIKLGVQGNTITLNYYPATEDNKTPTRLWSKIFRANTLTKLQVKLYLNILNSRQKVAFQSESITDIKDLVTACSSTGMSINFVKGQAVTKNNSVIIFKELLDKDLSFSLQPNCLKELNNFKLDCDSSTSGNYIVFTRTNYSLAIKKGLVEDTLRVPEQYVNNSMALCELTMHLHSLIPELNNIVEKTVGEDASCIFYFTKNKVHLKVAEVSSTYFLPMEVTNVSSLLTGNNVIGFSVKPTDLKLLAKLLTTVKEHKIYVYRGNIKIEFKNSSAILRSSLIKEVSKVEPKREVATSKN